MKKILGYYLKPYYFKMAEGFIIKFIGSIMDLCLPWILAYMIDSIIPRKDIGQIYLWGFIMIFCSIIAVTFNITANRMASRVSRNTTYSIRQDLFEKVMYLPENIIDTYTKPSLMSRLTTDTYNIHQMVGRIQRLGVRAPILLLGGLVITLILDPVLACILLITLPFLGGIMFFVSSKSIPQFTKLQNAVDSFVRIVREDISGIRVIKALSKENYERKRFESINETVISQDKKASILMGSIDPAVNVIMNLALVGVLIAGAYRVNCGQTEVGKILAFMTYFTIILNAMISISKMFVIASKGIASANRISEILDISCEDDILKIINNSENLKECESAHIIFKNVSFSYNHADESNDKDLENISFEIKKGKTLGILGGTGAGKTTIVSLLLGLYKVTNGNIYVDGENVNNLPVSKLRQKFGVVLQNDMIFEDSILNNIDLGRNLSDEELQEALIYARAKEFVDQKTDGINEQLDIKGANLSGGQRQRLLIARALAVHPEILILDDASSALDYRTDAFLRQGIFNNFKDTTKIIIAQRISSVMQADEIIVLEDGKVVGKGNHNELMKSCESYIQTAKLQMGGLSE